MIIPPTTRLQGSVSNYDQSIIINGYRLLGVESINLSHTRNMSPINALGIGYISCDIDSPPEAQISFDRNLISADPLIDLIGDNSFSGVLEYLDKKIGFDNAYLTSYSISCAIGEIPKINTDISIFGNMTPSSEHGVLDVHPPVYVPNNGSIIIECDGYKSNNVTNFEYSVKIERNPIYQVGSLYSAEVISKKPIEISANFTLNISDYEINDMYDLLLSQEKSNIKVLIKSADLSKTLHSYDISNAYLLSESISSSVDGYMSLNLSYISYLN